MNTEALLTDDDDAPPAIDLTGIRVLVVEDDDASRDVMAAVLGGCHAVVSVAASGQEALACVAGKELDVIVSDIGLPDIEGYDLIKAIRATPSGHDVPAIALTGHARTEEAMRALAAGFQVHLAKPTDPWLLADAVANVMGTPILDSVLDLDPIPDAPVRGSS